MGGGCEAFAWVLHVFTTILRSARVRSFREERSSATAGRRVEQVVGRLGALGPLDPDFLGLVGHLGW
ncbi:unannotated protein [freshwater metagenome]|uniref:Unannotated protein n=1 Tax=freshwater metagenome TaxID=449393 RepID=A0A6J6SU11_9ZZZZ